MKNIRTSEYYKELARKNKVKQFNKESENCSNHYWKLVDKIRKSWCNLINDSCLFSKCPKIE